MAKAKPIFEIDLGQRIGSKRFYTHEQINVFINDQLAAWAWLNVATIPNVGQAHQVRDTVNRLLGEVRSQYVNWQSDPGQHGAFYSAFRRAFTSLPLSGSDRYEFIDGLRKDAGDIVAAGAMSYFLDMTNSVILAEPPIIRGVLAAFLEDNQIHPRSTAAARRALDGLVAKYEKSQTDQLARARQADERLTEIQNRYARFSKVMRKFTGHRLRRQRLTGDAQVAEAIKRIDDTRDLYQRFMQLRGPVEYWTSKSKSHRHKAKIYRNVLIKFAIFGGLAVVGSLGVIAKIAFDHAKSALPDQPITLYLILVTIGAVITTIMFWAARVLVRLFMSEHHLAMDSEERATMVKTYLALNEKNAADEKDRALVLASLFRPTSDGIVKDDAAPDMSPAALISKALNKP